ncbi:ABC transporter C family member 8 [Linum perenne]
MGEFPWWLHSTWSLTLQLFLSIAVLFGVVGIGAVTGLVPLVICGFLNVPFAKVLQRCQSQFMVAQDERLRATSEILNSMKIIKLQSWEEKFKSLIESKRENEFKCLSAIQLMKPFASGLYWLSPTIISTVTFIGCALFRSAPLNASTIFTVLATLRGMGEPVRMIPECMSIMIQVQVSFNRVNAFLLDHELKNVDVSGSIAYVSQTSWIQSGTVPCALDKDINSFPHGDLTEIGQRGLNMSGGQKQRIQLARAVYNDADIYLLDDPFSAVDAHTAVILFNDCVMTALEKKTVILVTHQVEFLSSVDRILIDIPGLGNGTLIGIYSLISTLSAVFVYLRSLATACLGLRASKSFFSGFINAIFKAPMSFFDSTPVGRILTRASSDMSIVDFDIPFSILFVLGPLIELLATIGIMASVTWQVLIVAIFALIASKYVQGYYVATARELIRINGTTKAPVMNYASETSLGVVTIRAFKMVDRFFRNYMKLVDQDAMLFFHTNGVLEWLVIRIEALQNLTLFTAALLLVLLPKGTIAPGLIDRHCNLANYIVSVERIKQFMHIQPEPPAIVEDKRPPSSWPQNGRIELQQLKIRYRANAPLVLKGISCTFKEGTRIGVVGRTGSGKTTLISALFRLVEPDSGRILIDGLDICAMGLKDLRMKLSVIPQEPTLFRGSVRTNLDPLGLYTDHDIWEALEKCQLKATISRLPNLLDSSVSDEGENWSAGQRQLFCLGRVLLRRNKILVLDEATASIDSATDSILQKIIRQEFAECTVITVAHRVPTVIDSDMVMVLSYGELVEYDEPSRLMETSNSSFSKLVAEYWSSCRRGSYQNL